MGRRYKILIVDDDPEDLVLLEAVLKPHGYDVITISDGRQAIQVASNEKPDLILLDILMPELDGYTILNRIKDDEILKDIPVVIVTALGQDGPKIFASICGASAYVTKPIDANNLVKTVAKFVSGSKS